MAVALSAMSVAVRGLAVFSAAVAVSIVVSKPTGSAVGGGGEATEGRVRGKSMAAARVALEGGGIVLAGVIVGVAEAGAAVAALSAVASAAAVAVAAILLDTMPVGVAMARAGNTVIGVSVAVTVSSAAKAINSFKTVRAVGVMEAVKMTSSVVAVSKTMKTLLSVKTIKAVKMA